MATPGRLSVDDANPSQGSIMTFTYAVSADRLSAKNWIGIWPDPGDGPVDDSNHGASTLWEYAPAANGTVTISSGQLAPGTYLAFYLYDDGYTSLAEPVTLTVRATAQLPTPHYRDEFGSRGPERLAAPAGLATDDRGRCYVADPPAHSVLAFDRKGRAIGRIGRIGRSRLRDPQDVAWHDGRVYVVDAEAGSVEVFGPRGAYVSSLARGELDRPRGIAVERDGHLLVSDVGNNRVVRMDVRGHVTGEITAGVHTPHGIAIDGDRFWVVSSSRQYDGDNGVTCFVKDKPTVTLGYGQHSIFGGLSNPAHVAIDPRGRVVVSVPDFGFVSRFEPKGAFLGEFGTGGDGLLRWPQGVHVRPDGDILVADTGNGRVVRFGGTR